MLAEYRRTSQGPNSFSSFRRTRNKKQQPSKSRIVPKCARCVKSLVLHLNIIDRSPPRRNKGICPKPTTPCSLQNGISARHKRRLNALPHANGFMYKDFFPSCLCVVTSSSFIPNTRLLSPQCLSHIGRNPSDALFLDITPNQPSRGDRRDIAIRRLSLKPETICASVGGMMPSCAQWLFRIPKRMVWSSLRPQLAIAAVHQGPASIAEARALIAAIVLI